MTAAYEIEYLTHTLASSISDIGESPKVTNVDLGDEIINFRKFQ